MSEMVERIARAIAADNENWPYDRRPWSEQRYLLERARAVLAAMREPTKAMEKAVGEGLNHDGPHTTVPDNHWQRMIDAALGEEPKA